MLLKWCPICFQKLLLLLSGIEELQNLYSPSSPDQCIMCKSDENIVIIKNWSHLSKILSQFDQKNARTMCLKCICYIDIRNTIKERILLKHVSKTIKKYFIINMFRMFLFIIKTFQTHKRKYLALVIEANFKVKHCFVSHMLNFR